eukprot:TRINITY_DN36_c1_g1_i3.p1 TRINITY_DN36_c1_g1~~TRINITY_DN36_c1_g1_i3.p1  ORF type:complete len:128 (-),score=17.00 TRINITY_DN36_c1_g1_i3:206-589(-)
MHPQRFTTHSNLVHEPGYNTTHARDIKRLADIIISAAHHADAMQNPTLTSPTQPTDPRTRPTDPPTHTHTHTHTGRAKAHELSGIRSADLPIFSRPLNRMHPDLSRLSADTSPKEEASVLHHAALGV